MKNALRISIVAALTLFTEAAYAAKCAKGYTPEECAAQHANAKPPCYTWPGLTYEFMKALPSDVCARPRPGRPPGSSVIGFSCDEAGNPAKGSDASGCRDFPSKQTGGEWRVIAIQGPYVQLTPNLPVTQRDKKQNQFKILHKVGSSWEPWARANDEGRLTWFSPGAKTQYAASGGDQSHVAPTKDASPLRRDDAPGAQAQGSDQIERAMKGLSDVLKGLGK